MDEAATASRGTEIFMNIPGVDRLGLGALIGDHFRTLYRIDENDEQQPRRADRIVMLGIPLLAGVAGTYFKLLVYDISPILNGVAILAGGLFTLLVAIFGVSASSWSGLSNRVTVRLLVFETRANAAYATAWALAVVATLMIIQALRPPPAVGANPEALPEVITGLLIAMLLHLALTLLMVLNRIRLAFAELAR